MKKRVVVAMSGGVDSSVAAVLLKEQGYDVVGVTMRLWSKDDGNAPKNNKRCCSVEDVEDARRVCDILGIKHYHLNFEEEFQKYVVDYFVNSYVEGKTPHPCLACNDKIKFDFLFGRAQNLGSELIATGHYARIKKQNDTYKLLKGFDRNKDQSYVLFTLKQKELKNLLLPVGEYGKDKIREIAEKYNLPVANKPDSQDICFIPNGNYRQFIMERTNPTPGKIIDINGNFLGNHDGIQSFTIGQRRKLGLDSNGKIPYFVVKISKEDNTIIVGPHDFLFQNEFSAEYINIQDTTMIKKDFSAYVKIRYKSKLFKAKVKLTSNNTANIIFEEAQRAITPGQAVVFYDIKSEGEEVIGGGIIDEVISTNLKPVNASS